MESNAERIKFVPEQPLYAKKDNGALTRGWLRKVCVSAWHLFIESRRSKIRRQKEAVVRRQHMGIGRGTCLESQATRGEDRAISA